MCFVAKGLSPDPGTQVLLVRKAVSMWEAGWEATTEEAQDTGTYRGTENVVADKAGESSSISTRKKRVVVLANPLSYV